MIPAIKSCSWVSAILLLALAFPLQVLSNSPSIALLAYFPILLIYILPARHRASPQERSDLARLKGIDIAVILYFVLIFGHIFVAVLMNEISGLEWIRQTILFLFPATVYIYVSRFAREKEFKSICFGIVVAALIVGLYFVYDSFAKLVLGKLGDYQVRANEYSMVRMGVGADAINLARVSVGNRSMGLLESHTASGAWIGFGAFASFVLLSASSETLRWTVGLAWLLLLVAGINFTSILGFLITVVIVYAWRGAGMNSLLKIRRSAFRRAATFSCLALAAALAAFFYSTAFSDRISGLITLQLSKIFTTNIDSANSDASWVSWTLLAVKSYAQSVARHPFVLLFGTGPVVSDIFVRGGDVGFLETMALLGIPFVGLVVLGLVKMSRAVLKQLRLEDIAQSGFAPRGLLEFSLATILYVAIFEAHYSVWAYKSVLPILFIALGLVRRYGRARQSATP